MKTRFCIVGTGRISDWVLKGAVQDGRFKAVAVCSRSEDSARAFIARHPEAFGPDVQVFTSMEQVAQSPDIDAVYIGTPNSTHCPYTIAALEGGKHVLCEKPLACNSEEVGRMVDAARRNGRCLMEAMISTLNPNFRKAAELVGQIGPVRHCNVSYCQYSSKYDALKRGEVSNSFNPRMGGGALADIGIYTTYPVLALFGRPQSVKSNLVRIPTAFGDTDVQGTVEFSYPSMTAVLSFSKVVDSHLATEICGEGGSILLDAIHICRKLSLVPHAAPSSGRGAAAQPVVVAEGLPKDEYYYEFKEFMDVLESGRTESDVNSLELSSLNREIMDLI